MLELTNTQDLSKKEKVVFSFLHKVISEAVLMYRCKADGSIITNKSCIEDKLHLELNLHKHIYSYFPTARKDAFDVFVYHPPEEELALLEVMEITDEAISYNIELKYDIDYYIHLLTNGAQ